jgi:hypothetical protein
MTSSKLQIRHLAAKRRKHSVRLGVICKGWGRLFLAFLIKSIWAALQELARARWGRQIVTLSLQFLPAQPVAALKSIWRATRRCRSSKKTKDQHALLIVTNGSQAASTLLRNLPGRRRMSTSRPVCRANGAPPAVRQGRGTAQPKR